MSIKGNIILDGQKLAWHRDRVEAWLRGERIAPITIDCSLTRACSYRCMYCYGALQENENHRLSRQAVMDFIDDAAEIGVKAISFVSDGESAHSPYIYDAILRCKEKGLDCALGTNGYPLQDERLKDVLPALTYLRFNISAATPERYMKVHGVGPGHYEKVIGTIKRAVSVKKENGLSVTIGMQMVLMPQFRDDVLPLAVLGRELGADYFVIKHCSDDELGSLGIDYSKYPDLKGILEKAESMSAGPYLVKAKWSKIMSGGKRKYSKCFGAPFILQLSGSGLVAPCGPLFNDKFKERFHIGNIAESRFRDIWKSQRYWDVMSQLSSEGFDPRTDCGTLCLQHKVNEFLWDLKKGDASLPDDPGPAPMHVNFI